jgi:hypothetical protein
MEMFPNLPQMVPLGESKTMKLIVLVTSVMW